MFYAGEEAEFVFGRGTQIFPNAPFPLYGRTGVEMIADANGYWFEFGFRIDAELSGNAGTGWTDAGNYVRLEVQQSLDLETWHMGKFGPAPVDSVINRGDGTWEYWGRAFVPVYWETVLVDLTAVTTRYGKSITGVSVMSVPVSLPNFPYAMPAAAATLQADLRTAGDTGATVTTTSGTLTATAQNHTVGGIRPIVLTQSGGAVTAASSQGSSISLPSFPYALPAAAATLQADLRTAGHTGAVVMLHQDSWTILLPDRTAVATQREFSLTITPGDPFKSWDTFGNYQGENPANQIKGTSGNLRTPGGAPLEEAGRQFARLKISAGTRYSAFD